MIQTDNKKKKFRIGVRIKSPFQVLGGDLTIKHKKFNKRSRTLFTHNKKVKRIESTYNRLSKNKKFVEKYPTPESFLEKHTIKQVTKG